MSQIGFIAPYFLLLLALVALSATILKRLAILRERRFPTSSTDRIWPAVAILTVIVIALGRPFWGKEELLVSTHTAETMVVLDISQSMLAQDLKPSRLSAAKRKLKDLVKLLRERAEIRRLGLVVAAGASYLICPLTEDLETFLQFVDSAQPDIISTPGSDLEGAVRSAREGLLASGTEAGRILLLSDGEEERAEKNLTAQSISIPIDALGFGTLEGHPIELNSGAFVKDLDGETVITKLGERYLQGLASRSNGSYQRSTVDESDLRNIIESRKEQTHENRIIAYNELTSWVALIALFALWIVSFRNRSGVTLIALFLSFSLVHADNGYDGYKAYSQSKFKESLEFYKKAYAERPKDRKVIEGLAASLYRNEKFSEARDHYQLLSELAENAEQLNSALYNKGNSSLQLGESRAAIASYNRALTAVPDHKESLHNRRVAELLLTPTATPTTKPPPSPSPSPDSQSSPTPTQGAPTPGAPTPGAGPSPVGEEKNEEAQKKERDEGPKDDRELNREQAKQWLNSIPDTPLLIQRKKGASTDGGTQTW